VPDLVPISTNESSKKTSKSKLKKSDVKLAITEQPTEPGSDDSQN